MEKIVYRQFYELEKNHWWFRGMYELCLDVLKRYVGEENKNDEKFVLDVGCGTGLWSDMIRGYGNVIGFDRFTDAIDISKSRKIAYILQGSADSLPLKSESCDILTALGLIEHLDNDLEVLKEAKRVLKPGGYCLILTSAFGFLWGIHDDMSHHKRRYTRKELTTIAEQSGLEVKKATYVNTFLFLPVLIIRLLQRVIPGNMKRGEESPDLFMPPGPINYCLYKLLRFESWLLRFFNMPFGVGLVTVLHKPLKH